jgi:hypothetical protein
MFEKQMEIAKKFKYEILLLVAAALLFELLKAGFTPTTFALSSAILVTAVYLWVGYQTRDSLKLKLADSGMSGALVAFLASLISLFAGLLIAFSLVLFPDGSETSALAQTAVDNFVKNPVIGTISFIALIVIMVLFALPSAIWGAVCSSLGYLITDKFLIKGKGKKKIEK